MREKEERQRESEDERRIRRSAIVDHGRPPPLLLWRHSRTGVFACRNDHSRTATSDDTSVVPPCRDDRLNQQKEKSPTAPRFPAAAAELGQVSSQQDQLIWRSCSGASQSRVNRGQT